MAMPTVKDIVVYLKVGVQTHRTRVEFYELSRQFYSEPRPAPATAADSACNDNFMILYTAPLTVYDYDLITTVRTLTRAPVGDMATCHFSLRLLTVLCNGLKLTGARR